jgi:hypothetical protein
MSDFTDAQDRAREEHERVQQERTEANEKVAELQQQREDYRVSASRREVALGYEQGNVTRLQGELDDQHQRTGRGRWWTLGVGLLAFLAGLLLCIFCKSCGDCHEEEVMPIQPEVEVVNPDPIPEKTTSTTTGEISFGSVTPTPTVIKDECVYVVTFGGGLR